MRYDVRRGHLAGGRLPRRGCSAPPRVWAMPTAPTHPTAGRPIDDRGFVAELRGPLEHERMDRNLRNVHVRIRTSLSHRRLPLRSDEGNVLFSRGTRGPVARARTPSSRCERRGLAADPCGAQRAGSLFESIMGTSLGRDRAAPLACQVAPPWSRERQRNVQYRGVAQGEKTRTSEP